MIGRLRTIARRAYREFVPFLYGRTNFKLFLQRTMLSVDRRVAATLALTNTLPGFVRPVVIRAPFGGTILVVAPHHDDEIIGCGGAILSQLRSGGKVRIVFTQDGGDEHAADGRTRSEQVRIRENEAARVAEALGIAPPTFLRHQRLVGPELEALASDLREQLVSHRPDAVFVPFMLDYNRHHQLTCFGLAEALARVDFAPQVFGFEVWGLAIPNVVLNIDLVADEKFRLLDFYSSQLSGKDYTHGIKGLNMFHSLHFGAGECRFAERFFEMPAPEFVSAMRTIRSQVADSGDPAMPLDY